MIFTRDSLPLTTLACAHPSSQAKPPSSMRPGPGTTRPSWCAPRRTAAAPHGYSASEAKGRLSRVCKGLEIATGCQKTGDGSRADVFVFSLFRVRVSFGTGVSCGLFLVVLRYVCECRSFLLSNAFIGVSKKTNTSRETSPPPRKE